jgi:hypothetical protein
VCRQSFAPCRMGSPTLGSGILHIPPECVFYSPDRGPLRQRGARHATTRVAETTRLPMTRMEPQNSPFRSARHPQIAGFRGV